MGAKAIAAMLQYRAVDKATAVDGKQHTTTMPCSRFSFFFTRLGLS